MRQGRLPADVSLLLRHLAGEDVLRDARREKASSLHDMVERYVVAVMLYPGAEPARVLGVGEGASRDQMRSHMRWLMMWLHPDRADKAWRAPYSARVLEAWHKVSSAPSSALPPAAAPARNRRPQTRPVKLAWVAHPVATRTRTGRLIGMAAPLLIVMALAALAVFDNPLRQWAEAAFTEHAPRLLETRAGS